MRPLAGVAAAKRRVCGCKSMYGGSSSPIVNLSVKIVTVGLNVEDQGRRRRIRLGVVEKAPLRRRARSVSRAEARRRRPDRWDDSTPAPRRGEEPFVVPAPIAGGGGCRAAAAPMPRVLVARGAAGDEEDDKPWSSFCGFHGGRCRLRRAFQLVLKKQNKKLETWIVFFCYTFPKTSC